MSKLIPCTKAEFDAFLAGYPRRLVRDVFAAYEPPCVTFNDFSIAPAWPESVVASYRLGDPPGCGHYYGEDSGYKILQTAAAD